MSSSSGANWLSTMSRIMSGSTRKYSWTTTLRRPAIEVQGVPACSCLKSSGRDFTASPTTARLRVRRRTPSSPALQNRDGRDRRCTTRPDVLQALRVRAAHTATASSRAVADTSSRRSVAATTSTRTPRSSLSSSASPATRSSRYRPLEPSRREDLDRCPLERRHGPLTQTGVGWWRRTAPAPQQHDSLAA